LFHVQTILEKIIVYTPDCHGSGKHVVVGASFGSRRTEMLMVGKERRILNWFYKGLTLRFMTLFRPRL